MEAWIFFVLDCFPYFLATLAAVFTVEIIKASARWCCSSSGSRQTPQPINLGDYPAFKKREADTVDDAEKPLTFEEQLATLERERDSKIIFLVPSKAGGVLDRLVSPGDSSGLTLSMAEDFVRTLRKIPFDTTLDIVLNTSGASCVAMEVIINAILNHEGQVRIHVPFRATSAGTLISLAADRVYADRNSFFGPADSQRWGISVPALARYIPDGDGFMGLYNFLRDMCQQDEARTQVVLMKIYAYHREQKDQIWDDAELDRLKALTTGRLPHDAPLFTGMNAVDFPNFVPEIEDEIHDIYEAYLENKTPKSSGGLFGGLL